MAGATFAADGPRRAPVRHGQVVVIGGGCYGHYYLRQLGRAAAAGALAVQRVVVIDRDASCRVAVVPPAEANALDWQLAVAAWDGWLDAHLDRLGPEDAIVPSPLMPHLFFDWLLGRARQRWPERSIRPADVPAPPATIPWHRAAPDGRHYVSYATWMCPINCVEPARCPHTRGARDWSLPVTVAAWADARAAEGQPFAGTAVFHCTHRAYGVGMIDVRDLLDADRMIAQAGERDAGVFLVGTASHCHGALAAFALD